MAQPAALATMADYYARRASIYERVYHKPERQADLRAMEAWLTPRFEGRRVLEIACGTGWWTPHGARLAASWLATDLNPETMAIARSKPLPRRADGSPIVGFRAADAYTLAELGNGTAPRPAEPAVPRGEMSSPPVLPMAFDAAFAGCWWSHVPLARLSPWLALLHARLEPGARVVMLDNRFVQTSSTPISRTDDDGNTYQQRTLDDGSVYEVVKNFPCLEQAIAALGPRARDPRWVDFDHYWLLHYQLA